MSLTIISGGSTGAERGALQAAIDLGLAIGGWRCAGDDTPPIFAESMSTTSSADRGMTRRLCVQDSDGVLAVSTQVAQLGGVIAFVDRQAEAQGKAFMSVTLGQRSDPWRAQILGWMRDQGIHRLYVTGPAEDDEPGITAAARAFLKWLLEGLALDELGKFIDIVKVLEGAQDSDQPVTPPAAVARGSMIRPADLEPEQWPAETRQQSYSNHLTPVDCRGEPPDVTIGLPGDDLGTLVDLKPGEFLITREQHRQLMVDIVTGKKQIEHEILEATCTDPDAFTRAMDHEVAAANETADRRERCLDAHGYGCTRPECGRSAVNADDMVGLTDFLPQTEGDPPP